MSESEVGHDYDDWDDPPESYSPEQLIASLHEEVRRTLAELKAKIKAEKKWWEDNGMDGSIKNEGRIEAYDFVLKVIAEATPTERTPKAEAGQ